MTIALFVDGETNLDAEHLNPLVEAANTIQYAVAAAPATGTWVQGDRVQNSAPAEAGSSLSKYVVIGWICTVSGTPGTWLEQRVLTGN